jgi:hypothetical protein
VLGQGPHQCVQIAKEFWKSEQLCVRPLNNIMEIYIGLIEMTPSHNITIMWTLENFPFVLPSNHPSIHPSIHSSIQQNIIEYLLGN